MFSRIALLSLFFLLAMNSFGQKEEDNVIVVHVEDSIDLCKRVRNAITYTDLIIRDDSNCDTLITLSERISGKTIFVIAKVRIAGNIVRISGAYGLGMENFWGYPAWPKSYKRITYFKGSEAWLILRRIAIKLDSKMSFDKESEG